MEQKSYIRTVRDDLGLSQAEFASAMGVDQSTVSLWESKGLPNRALTREAIEHRIELIRSSREQAA